MEQLGISHHDVDECIVNSFATRHSYSSYNELLGQDRQHSVQSGIDKTPSLTINGHPYGGDFDAKQVFESICSAFHYDKRPGACKADFALHMALKEAEEDFVREPYGFDISTVILTLVIVLLCNVLTLFYCHKKRQKSVKNLQQRQVQLQVEQYVKLGTNETT